MRVDRSNVPLEMSPDEFRETGHELVDQIADFLASLPDRPVFPDNSAEEARQAR